MIMIVFTVNIKVDYGSKILSESTMIWVDYVQKYHGRICSVNTSNIYYDCGRFFNENRS